MPRVKLEKKYHFLYKTTNLINGKYYVGVHSTNNLNDGYLGSGKYLRNSVHRYGKNNFKCEILEFFPDRDSLMEREKELVNPNFLKNSLCMNLIIGGTGGELLFHSETTKLKMSRWIRTPEYCEKISKSLTGRKLTKEHREAVSKGRKGLKHSDETKSKMSQVRSGMKFSDEWMLNMSKPKSDSHKLKMRKPKPVSTCSVCNFTTAEKNITLYHNDKCRMNSILELGKEYFGNNFAVDHKKEYQTARNCGYLNKLKNILKRIKE